MNCVESLLSANFKILVAESDLYDYFRISLNFKDRFPVKDRRRSSDIMSDKIAFLGGLGSLRPVCPTCPTKLPFDKTAIIRKL